MKTETTLRRWGVVAYGMREARFGGYISVEDLRSFLRDLESNDDATAMLAKIINLKEQLDD